MTTQEAITYNADQDQTAHLVQSDLDLQLIYTVHFSIQIITELFLHLAMEVFF